MFPGYTTNHAEVDRIARLQIQGNHIAHSWYKHIQREHKKFKQTDHLAVSILGRLVDLWIATGCTESVECSLEDFAQIFGASTQVVRRSLALLEHLNLVSLRTQSIQTDEGTVPTILLAELNVQELTSITYLV